MSAIYVLWLRELKRFLRSKVQIVSALAQPLLYLLIMGFGFNPVYEKAGGGSYLNFIAPGIIAMTVMFSATFSGMTLLWDRQFGLLKGTLVAPVSRWQITVGRACGAATVAFIQGLLVTGVCLGVGFRPVSLNLLPIGFLFLMLTAVVFAALGTAIGATLKKTEGFQVVMNFLMLPIFLLSGAMFPLMNLPVALAMLTKIDPLSYGVDGLRAALTGQTHFGMTTDATILVVLSITFLALGSWRVSKVEI